MAIGNGKCVDSNFSVFQASLLMDRQFFQPFSTLCLLLLLGLEWPATRVVERGTPILFFFSK
jgi:hypothetical protein